MIIRALLGNEEADSSESAKTFLKSIGVEPSNLVLHFKNRLEEEARRKYRGTGRVPASYEKALQSIRQQVKPSNQAPLSPEIWLDQFFGEALVTSQEQRIAVSFRNQTEELDPEDQKIIEMLKTEITPIK